MDNPFKSPAILSFCPGILGLERGLNRAIGKLNTIAYVEIEAFVVANLVAQMESGLLAPTPIWTNVKTFDALPFRGKVHGIMGGYPCTPFSVIGKQTGEDHESHLWPYIKRSIATIRPFWCFFENVANHLNIGYSTVKRELEEFGYSVKEGIYTAEEIGAPHIRERLFILALDNSILSGLEGYARNVDGSLGQKRRSPAGPIATSSIFPCERGIHQRQWEEPRVNFCDESKMEYIINGYNFTTDLHRAIGNSVVEQTAELAFISLLEKHIINTGP